MLNILVILLASFLFCACYSSSSKAGHDSASEDGRDAPDRDARDDVEDHVQDIDPDPVPFAGIDFIVENVSPPEAGLVYYFSVWEWTPVRYPFDLRHFSDGDWNSISMYEPWCSIPCSDAHGDNCCILCEDMIDAVKVLDPGGSFSFHWDGTLFAVDYDRCECGCHYPYRILEGDFEIGICARTDMECYEWVECEPDENGIIWGSYPTGEELCTIERFALPEASGDTIVFYF